MTPIQQDQTLALAVDTATDLSALGFIAISGIDAKKFLQGQVTCDLNDINPQQTRLGAHCTPKGRIQFTFRLFVFHDTYYLRLPIAMIDIALAALKKYGVFFKITLEKVANDWMGIGLSGHHVEKFLRNSIGSIPGEISQCHASEDLLIVRLPGPFPRFEIYGTKAAITNLWESCQKQVKKVGWQAWELFDIMAGIPTILPETSNLFTPHEISYQLINGVSFEKGCYTGQEIVARMHYLGKLKSKLQRVHIDSSELKPGAKLVNNESRQVGTIVNVAQDATKGFQALANIENAALDKDIYLEDLTGRLINIVL